MSEINPDEKERLCKICGLVKNIEDFPTCSKSFQGRRRHCKKCAYQFKVKRAEKFPVEHKIHQMADNIHKRLVTNVDTPANKSYKDKGIISKIGNSGAEIYKYLYENFYEDVKNMLDNDQVPSIDRIDSEKHYEHGNLRIITFEENSKMGREQSKKVCQRAVRIIWANGKEEIIESIKLAAKHLGIGEYALGHILKGRTKQKKEFSVEYLGPPKVKPKNYYKNLNKE